MSLTISEEEFYKKYKYNKVRGYVDYDGRWDDDTNRKEEREHGNYRRWVVYNQTLTPAEGGDKAVYRVCESESEAIAIVRMLNTIFESHVTVEFDIDDDDREQGVEEVMTYEHQMVTWAYA